MKEEKNQNRKKYLTELIKRNPKLNQSTEKVLRQLDRYTARQIEELISIIEKFEDREKRIEEKKFDEVKKEIEDEKIQMTLKTKKKENAEITNLRKKEDEQDLAEADAILRDLDDLT